MHPAWGTYPDTILRFPEGDLTIDLRRPVSPHARLALSTLGLERPFAVITACDPLGSPHGKPENHRLSAVFEAQVKQRYPGARRADGTSPDGAHVEAGWALPAPLADAVALAARFFQNGIFWFDGDRFSIVPVLAPHPPLTLPAGGGSR